MWRISLEGTLEHFTIWDAFYYVGKALFGPFKPLLPQAFNQSPIPKRPKDEGDSIAFTFLGDVMVNKLVSHRKPDLYARLPAGIFACDLLFANLEFPIQPAKPIRGFPRFNGSADYFDLVLAPLGPGCLNIANNHCLDMGWEGLEATVDFLQRRGIPYVGREEGGCSFKTLTIKGREVSITGFTHSTNRQKNHSQNPVNLLRLNNWKRELNGFDHLLKMVAEMKEAGDIVLLNLHWGLELELGPTAHQVDMAHRLIESGVDLLIGHHPHVLQPLEIWPGPDGAPRLIIYSLGNWVTNTRKTATRVTAAVKAWVNKEGHLQEVETHPFLFSYRDLTYHPLRKDSPQGRYVPESFWDCMVKES